MEKGQISGIELIEAVDEKVKDIRTRSLDISFNELLGMYEDGELVVDPEYQRLFRWSEGKQSRFIESLLLELPLPPIFVIELADGKYELLDGLQSISSCLHFRGVLHEIKKEDGTHCELKLSECDIVENLNNHTYQKLPTALKLKLKRNFIRVEVIRKESDPRLRYYMFKRLNTGGEGLSDQEMRNCTIRLLDDEFNKVLIKLSKNEDFKKCISTLTEEKIKQKYDQELVLRFFAFKNYRDNFTHDVGDFMTEYMEVVSDPNIDEITFNDLEEIPVFTKTFKILQNTLGNYAFSRVNEKEHFVSGFVVYHYEAFTLGIQKHLNMIDLSKEGIIERLKKEFLLIKNDSEFRSITTGGGKNTPGALKKRIEFVERRLEDIYGSR